MTTLMLTGEPLSISDVVAVARAGRRVALAPRRSSESSAPVPWSKRL